MLTDLALGGQNHQIEHHLSPSMPRPNLHHAQARVRGVLSPARHSLHADKPAASYTHVLRHLHTLPGRRARNPRLTQPPQAQVRLVNRAQAEDSLGPAPQAGAY